MGIFDEIAGMFGRKGREAYLGESVSQAEHALQAAALADAEKAPDALVVAALLHDVGHLTENAPEDLAGRGVDGRHEDAGADWLSRAFGPDVAEPARLHVAAKRYLCAVDPAYLGGLSPASALSLKLQGGPFDAGGRAGFEANPHAGDAVRLRRWDDAAKEVGLDVPGLGHYRARIEAVARSAQGAGR